MGQAMGAQQIGKVAASAVASETNKQAKTKTKAKENEVSGARKFAHGLSGNLENSISDEQSGNMVSDTSGSLESILRKTRMRNTQTMTAMQG